MKRKLIMSITLPLIVIAFTFFHCPSKKDLQPLDLTGEWKLDSIYFCSLPPDSAQLVFADELKSISSFRFNADSIFNRVSVNDSTAEKYYATNSILYIDEGKGFTSYSVKSKNDSLFEFAYKRNLMLVLKKQ